VSVWDRSQKCILRDSSERLSTYHKSMGRGKVRIYIDYPIQGHLAKVKGCTNSQTLSFS
jgi:hypothetical protein